VKGLAIKDVAEQTGLAAGTIRMWEQRYGFPEPDRTPSGYRMYTPHDVETLRRVVAYREGGLSVPAALDRARAAGGPTDRPSIYGAVMAADGAGRPLVLTKRTLLAISRGIEDETLARAAGPVVVGAFQHDRHFRAVEHRYQRLAQLADICVAFADFGSVAGGGDAPWELPITPDDALGNEWAVVVDAPGYAACLLAWELPESRRDEQAPEAERRFEAMWTLDPHTVRRAALVAAALARRSAPEVGAEMERLLESRPLAVESPAPALTALTNRIVAYMDERSA
jgi:DICT domain-containing protein